LYRIPFVNEEISEACWYEKSLQARGETI